jgi:hypothetical protein
MAATASVLVLLASAGLALAASPSQAARPVSGTYQGFDGRPAEINRATPNAGLFDLTAALEDSTVKWEKDGVVQSAPLH